MNNITVTLSGWIIALLLGAPAAFYYGRRIFRELALLKMKTQSRSGGLQPQEDPDRPTKTAAPIYFPQGQPFTFNNNLIEQLLGAMFQIMFVAMIGRFAKQCVKIAVP